LGSQRIRKVPQGTRRESDRTEIHYYPLKFQEKTFFSGEITIVFIGTSICFVANPLTMNENEISKIVLDEAIYVHTRLGPGLLETAYEHCLAYRLKLRGLGVRMQYPVPLIFEEVKLDCGYRADILVENKVVLEIKSIEGIADIHLAQTLTYLRFLKVKLGLVLNFNVILMKNGIRRVVNGL